VTNYDRECLRAAETLPGEFEYQEARLAAQRRMDELAFGIHTTLDGGAQTPALGSPDWSAALLALGGPAPADAGPVETEQALMYFLTSFHIDGEKYLYRGHVYPADLDQVEDLIRWQRARPATDKDLAEQEDEACRESESGSTIGSGL
jgi:hypothetical protein